MTSWLGTLLALEVVHHKHARHQNNYGDITWWDMLFGTYENPQEWTKTCGFDDALEQKLPAMLTFEDVHQSASSQQ